MLAYLAVLDRMAYCGSITWQHHRGRPLIPELLLFNRKMMADRDNRV
jgi:hypothetical protein